MITQSTVFNELKEQFTDKQAMMLADLMVRTINVSSLDMATSKDIELLRSETAKLVAEAKIEQIKAQNRTTIWLVSTVLTAAGLIIAGLKFL